MLVKYWMRKDVATIDVDDSMQDAMNLMKEHAVAMLPVMRNNQLVGVVTDRDLKRASPRCNDSRHPRIDLLAVEDTNRGNYGQEPHHRAPGLHD